MDQELKTVVSAFMTEPNSQTLVSLKPGEASGSPWEVGWARGVDRTRLRAHLGEPFHVETDSHCTFGGEEDWWEYRTSTGQFVAVCLRVPYQDAVLCVSEPSSILAQLAATLLAPWTVEFFDSPHHR